MCLHLLVVLMYIGPEDFELATAPPLVNGTPPTYDETPFTNDVVNSSTQHTEDVPEIPPPPNLEPMDDDDSVDT